MNFTMPPQKKFVPPTGEAALKLFDATRPAQLAGGSNMPDNGESKPRKRARSRQTKIAGSSDEIPKDLQDKVVEYVATLRERLARQQEENVLRAEVIELMHKHRITTVPLDEGTDEEKRLILEQGNESIKIKPVRN